MELQHVNVKLLVNDPAQVDLEPLIPVFHNWIERQIFDELLLDIADYRHVHEGPGVVLIGHQGNYSVDNVDGRLGIRYNRKAALEGSNQDRLHQAMRSALNACQRLETEPGLGGAVRFGGQEIDVFLNDRLLAPNIGETRTALEREFEAFWKKLFRGAEYSVSYPSDPRRLFGFSVKTSRPFSTADLLANLAA
ncbi:MAG TPA: hypothetical protein VFB23_00120 [Candidatus Acidoferrales bacterium]|nr:hypothetical protein [Candidatus Acidoferrales bacterium]